MGLVFQISTELSPEQMLTEIRASSIDPNDLVSMADLLVQFQSRDHAKVAWEEAIRQFDAAPSRIAPDVNLVHIKRNLCIATLPSPPLKSFRWISEKRTIAPAPPILPIYLAA